MDLTQYKIEVYENGVSSLPDYPSDEGYTAEQLKAIFDARSDGEIKTQHNGLIDALISALAEISAHALRTDNPHGVTAAQTEAEAQIEAHNAADNAHTALYERIYAELANALGEVEETLAGKVDKEEGKGLSTNDYTNAEQQKVNDALITAAGGVSGLTGHMARADNPHKVTAAQVGLENVDNTSDLSKPVSTATKEYIDEIVGEIKTLLDSVNALADAYISEDGEDL